MPYRRSASAGVPKHMPQMFAWVKVRLVGRAFYSLHSEIREVICVCVWPGVILVDGIWPQTVLNSFIDGRGLVVPVTNMVRARHHHATTTTALSVNFLECRKIPNHESMFTTQNAVWHKGCNFYIPRAHSVVLLVPRIVLFISFFGREYHLLEEK